MSTGSHRLTDFHFKTRLRTIDGPAVQSSCMAPSFGLFEVAHAEWKQTCRSLGCGIELSAKSVDSYVNVRSLLGGAALAFGALSIWSCPWAPQLGSRRDCGSFELWHKRNSVRMYHCPALSHRLTTGSPVYSVVVSQNLHLLQAAGIFFYQYRHTYYALAPWLRDVDVFRAGCSSLSAGSSTSQSTPSSRRPHTCIHH